LPSVIAVDIFEILPVKLFKLDVSVVEAEATPFDNAEGTDAKFDCNPFKSVLNPLTPVTA
jgi:hypothetical protein